MKKAKIIILDGIDGCGKTTIAKYLAKKFNGLYLAEPGKVGLRGKIRKLILDKIDYLAEFLLFWADRRLNYQLIKKFLQKPIFIFLDRSFPSTLAYQLYAKNLKKLFSENEYLKIDRIIRDKIEPDAVLILDAVPETALKRINKRAKTKFEKINFLRKVRKAYLYLAKKYGWQIIDANKPLEEVKKEIIEVVKNLLK